MRITDIHDIPPELRNEIEHFFAVYKDLEDKKVETRRLRQPRRGGAGARRGTPSARTVSGSIRNERAARERRLGTCVDRDPRSGCRLRQPDRPVPRRSRGGAAKRARMATSARSGRSSARAPARVKKRTRRGTARSHHYPELIGLAMVAFGLFLATSLPRLGRRRRSAGRWGVARRGDRRRRIRRAGGAARASAA